MRAAIEINLKIVEAKREGDKWSVLAELTFHNRGQKDFELDEEAAVCRRYQGQ